MSIKNDPTQDSELRTQDSFSIKRVLILNNVPAPYFTPLFEKLGQESGWDLTVCYSSAWNQAVGWEKKGFDERDAHRTIILDEQRPTFKRYFGGWNAAAAALLTILAREKPDYLICYGYTLSPQMTALSWAMTKGVPFAVSGDANIYCESSAGVKRRLKTTWMRQVARRASALITVGRANRLFWQTYGARPEQLFDAGFAVDNDYFALTGEARRAEAESLRANLNLTGRTVFLFVGRLIKRKNVDLIIKAARRLNHPRIGVVIAGAGEEMENLKTLAAGDQGIIFAGVVAPADLPLYYAMADVLVLPASQEPWGLVVNEAMACGLAVIAHHHCGAAIDLVSSDNGVSLETFEVEEMAAAMKLIAENEAVLRSMQQRSREKIAGWSIEAAARGIIYAVEKKNRQD